MIRSLYLSNEGKCRTGLQVDQFPAALQDVKGLLWVDFEGSPPETDEPILQGVFGFHPLAIDDALQESHIPKVDDWGEYLYIVLHSASFTLQDGGALTTRELDVFLGPNYLVTHHDDSIPALERVWDICQRDESRLLKGPDHLLYLLVDEVAASYMPVIEAIDDAIDQAEDEIFERPSPHTLEHIFALKRAALNLRRIIGPQREVLNRLARDDYKMIDARDQVYFRDVYDHMVRMHDISESLRDLIGGALDTYLSVINNRMNDIMKTLTVITTLFMPITFITGFFGMNYFQPVSERLAPWTGYFAFAVTLALFFATPAVMFLWMRRRGWM